MERDTTTVGIPVRIAYDVYQSYVAELDAAKRHAEAGRTRDAIGAAQRAWEYYGDFALHVLGVSDAQREQLRKGSLGLHDDNTRKLYVQRTGDKDLAADAPGWRRVQESVRTRNSAEHRGKPVTSGELGTRFTSGSN